MDKRQQRTCEYVGAVALLLMLSPGPALSQHSPQATPAVKRWIDGLNSRKEGRDQLRAKLKLFANGPDGNSPGVVPPALGCPLALEAALVDALAEAHVTENGIDEFHLIINGRLDGEYLDVSYRYDRRSQLTLTGIQKLPINWKIAFQPGEASINKFIIVTDEPKGCIFEFDSADPFLSKAISKE